ncbi:type II secretion system protein [Enterobacter sp. RHBSTW-00994]|uniref:type II secretion system protein n=1 Tax=Enterobacter sp. RHBSTW-00994 TaxID=2742676 RepID=UPI0015E9E31C|nr:type II secretion system protein [Enterobacter sp. RHBSTW-00994]QLR43343.1 type II secretion system protein [Enterobacter sp. RHBSTW-00994]
MKKNGFTLIEMMVTLVLLSTLAAAVAPLVQRYQQRQKEEQLREALRDIRSAIDRYKQASSEGRIEKKTTESGYPPSLKSLVEGVPDETSPNHSQLYFLRRIPRDPMCDCASRPADQTWRVRSSTQASGEFDGGKDLFDVSSSNNDSGLNGIPYAQW